MPLSTREALASINTTLGTDYKSFADIQAELSSVPNPNEKLKDMLNKITKMLISDSFNGEMLNYWEKTFELGSQTLEIGAIAEAVDVGLLAVKDDTITSGSDLLPDVNTQPRQYIIDIARNVKKRIELYVNESIFTRAFTSINAYNSFINIVVKRIKDTKFKFMYEFNFQQLGISLKNTADLGKTSYTNFFTDIYNDLSQNTPYTSALNLGAVKDATVIKKSTTNNNVGVDTPADMPVKENTLATSKSGDNVIHYDDLILLIPQGEEVELNRELATIYHSNFLSVADKFKAIIPIQQNLVQPLQVAMGIIKAGDPVKKLFAIVIDSASFLCFWNVQAQKDMFWNKGEGEGGRSIVYSFWASIAFNPWRNGRAYFGDYEAPNQNVLVTNPTTNPVNTKTVT